MRVEEWLRATSSKACRLADRLGVTRASVSRWVTGVSRPRPETCIELYHLTNGAVGLMDYYPELVDAVMREVEEWHND